MRPLSEIYLFLPYYNCGDPERQAEIDYCIQANANDERFTHIFVLVDDNSELPVHSDKLTRIDVEGRPTYQDWIRLSLEHCQAGVSLLANSDIFFKEGLDGLPALLEPSKTFLALSRWEYNGDQVPLEMHPNPQWSQDVWGVAVKSLRDEKHLLADLAFGLGVPRCDNTVAYVFSTRGWKVVNPCHDVVSAHFHTSQSRFYDKKQDETLVGGTAYVWPLEYGASESVLEYDIWSLRPDPVQSVSVNPKLAIWTGRLKDPCDKPSVSNPPEATADTPPAVSLQPAAADLAAEDEDYILEEAKPSNLLHALEKGWRLHRKEFGFNLFLFDGVFYFNVPSVTHRAVSLRGKRRLGEADLTDALEAMGWAAAHLVGIGADIRDQAKNLDDLYFWQFPALTEKQAYANHYPRLFAADLSSNLCLQAYLPVPWATYIDRKTFPDSHFDALAARIHAAKTFADRAGVQLEVHTVCQHIRWKRALPTFEKVGLTHLHLSHKNQDTVREPDIRSSGIAVASWPLIAVNHEIKSRSHGLASPPMKDRPILASFVGAHMKHYIDNSRPALHAAAQDAQRDDVIVELGETWHFNKIVYDGQVFGKSLDAAQLSETEQKTVRYNQLMSKSRFALCPVGAGPNTLRFWEAIAIGTIPVLFSSNLSLFEEDAHGREALQLATVWERPIDASLFEWLAEHSLADLESRRDALMDLYGYFATKRCF